VTPPHWGENRSATKALDRAKDSWVGGGLSSLGMLQASLIRTFTIMLCCAFSSLVSSTRGGWGLRARPYWKTGTTLFFHLVSMSAQFLGPAAVVLVSINILYRFFVHSRGLDKKFSGGRVVGGVFGHKKWVEIQKNGRGGERIETQVCLAVRHPE